MAPPTHNALLRFKIRLTKWISKRAPAWLVYRILVRTSTIPDQAIFQEAFRIADPTKTALDIGANRGIVSYYIARRFAKVHSFEPNADLASFLKKVLPSNCTLHHCALSDTPGEHELSVVLESGIPIHGKGRILETSGSPEAYAIQKIKLETLDDQRIDNIGFIKIDVEGHEDKAIQGGLETLRANKPVLVIEIEKRHTGKSPMETITRLEALGYDAFFFENGTKRPVSAFEDRMQDPDYPLYINDFLFVPKA